MKLSSNTNLFTFSHFLTPSYLAIISLVFLRLHRILLLIIIALDPLFVRADIAESDEALVKRRQHNQLKLLNEKFGRVGWTEGGES